MTVQKRDFGAHSRPESGNFRYDLAVAYRIYPKVSKPAQNLPLGDDKLRQAEACLRSFKDSLGSLRVKMWVILDGCPTGYHDMFKKHFCFEDLVFIELDGIGNRTTYSKQLDVLLNQDDAQFVYLAEDDYVYLPQQFPQMLRFLASSQEIDFVSPYDHPDCYQLLLHRQPKWLKTFEGRHWRTASSTCLTFLSRKSTLSKYSRTLRTYSRGNGDCAMWLSLTKSRVFNPFVLFLALLKREFYWTAVAKAWRFGWEQIVFGQKAKLWVPLPGAATHLCEGLLAPSVDWLALMQKETRRDERAEMDLTPEQVQKASLRFDMGINE